MANFKKNTRYTNGIINKNREGTSFLQLRSNLGLTPDQGDVVVTISQDLLYRPDLISQKAYNTPDLWWVIAEYNNIFDPIFDLQIGQTLKIPAISRVLAAIKVMGL